MARSITKPTKRTRSRRITLDPTKIVGAIQASMPAKVLPQLATLVDAAPAGDQWLHELKFDGYRIIAIVEDGEVRLLTRRGNDWTSTFPAVAEAICKIPVKSAILEGELVANDEHGISRFQLLQNSIKSHSSEALVFFAFDLLYVNGFDLRRAALIDRKTLLSAILGHAGHPQIRLSEHVVGHGRDVFQNACKMGLEGIISKRADSRYESRRSPDWVKVKCHGRQEFIICGFTAPEGSRVGFGSLLLGYYAEDGLHYCGRVGTGFDAKGLVALHKKLDALVVTESPFSHKLAAAHSRGATFVKPKLVCEVEFTEWTDDRRLRHPSFQGLRADKAAKDVVRELPKKL